MKKKRGVEAIPGYERVMRRTEIPLDKSQCWLWKGPVNNAGYGMIRGNDGYPKMTTVHRIVGLHKGLDRHREIQHTCLVKNCVNPDHLVNGNAKSRMQRLSKKYDGYWCRPKNPYKTCKYCKKTTHVIWFPRMHKDCYLGMSSNYICKKV